MVYFIKILISLENKNFDQCYESMLNLEDI
jgi:hypothetical protein